MTNAKKDKKRIGEKLLQLRKSQKMTQEDVAEKIGITRSTVSNYEVGRRAPHITDLKRYAAIFNVGLDYFEITEKDDALDLLARAQDVFRSQQVPDESKEALYQEFMKLYLELKTKGEEKDEEQT